MDIEQTDDIVQVAKLLANSEDELFCNFVAYGMKPINKFNIAFQTHASDVGMLRSYVRSVSRQLSTSTYQRRSDRKPDRM